MQNNGQHLKRDTRPWYKLKTKSSAQEQNYLSNFARRSSNKHNIVKLGGKITFKGFFCFSSGSHFEQLTETVLATLVEDHLQNIPVK